MRKVLTVAGGFLLMLLIAYALLHWLATGELEAWARYGWSRTLRWEQEPVQVVVAALVKVGLFFLGAWMAIDGLLRDDAPPEEPS